MLYGLDALGAAMFPNIALKAWPLGFACGVFAETFGNVWGFVDKLAASGKCPSILIHGPWTNHAYNPKLHDKSIFLALDKAKEMSTKHPGVHFQFSPVCESDARGAQWQELFKKLSARRGSVELVCSVGTKGELIPGILAEVHGDTRVPSGEYQYSYDGTSSVDSDVTKDKRTHSRARMIRFWVPAFNLKYKTSLSGDEPANVKINDSAPPQKRNCKPTIELIQSVAALAADKGSTSLKPKNLWKSHADRHETPPEPRAYKPVLITPADVREVVLVDSTGKVVAKSTRKEPYVDGRKRYYYGAYGYQIASGILTVKAGSEVLGTVNPAFREGDYR